MGLSSATDAYDRTGRAWQDGPGFIYDRMARVIVGLCPGPLTGASVLDLGAGTGAASRALTAVGARPIALDAATGMLLVDRDGRPPAVAGDADALPFPDGVLEGAIAAFSITHLDDPVAGVTEAARVVRPGGFVVMSGFAADSDHPAKEAVERVLRAWGWTPPPWYVQIKEGAEGRLGHVDELLDVVTAGGLAGAEVTRIVVDMGETAATALAAWRLGTAHVTPFLNELGAQDAQRVRAEVEAEIGDASGLELAIVVGIGTVQR